MPARPRPGRTAPETSRTIANEDVKSRQKAETSKATTERDQQVVSEAAESPVFSADGTPLAKITFAGSELIPTGQYANVNLGPVVATVWVDLRSDDPLPQAHLERLVSSSNKLAETVLRDILGVQRNLVLENLAEDTES